MLHKAICCVIQCTVPVGLLQISTNVTQTMEAVHRYVPTHQGLFAVMNSVITTTAPSERAEGGGGGGGAEERGRERGEVEGRRRGRGEGRGRGSDV